MLCNILSSMDETNKIYITDRTGTTMTTDYDDHERNGKKRNLNRIESNYDVCLYACMHACMHATRLKNNNTIKTDFDGMITTLSHHYFSFE